MALYVLKNILGPMSVNIHCLQKIYYRDSAKIQKLTDFQATQRYSKVATMQTVQSSNYDLFWLFLFFKTHYISPTWLLAEQEAFRCPTTIFQKKDSKL